MVQEEHGVVIEVYEGPPSGWIVRVKWGDMIRENGFPTKQLADENALMATRIFSNPDKAAALMEEIRNARG